MKEHLTADQLLLINHRADFYKKVPEKTLEKIRAEVSMEFVGTTISEHSFNQRKNRMQPAVLENYYRESFFIRRNRLNTLLRSCCRS